MTSGEIVSWSLTPSFNRNENKDSISFKSLTLAFSVGFTPRDERVKNSQFANGLLDVPPCGGTTNLLKTAVRRLRREFTVEFEVLSVIGWRVPAWKNPTYRDNSVTGSL